MLTRKRLRQLLAYDGRTGEFRWREWRGGTAFEAQYYGEFVPQ